jgi:poly(3-hydroxybutyrate) depolymerase
MGAGHYGIFSGRRWREKVYPRVRDFIAAYGADVAAKAKRPSARIIGTSDNGGPTAKPKKAPVRRKRQAA